MLCICRSAGLLSDISQRLLQNVSFRCQRVQSLRIGNAVIPDNKRLRVALQHIHGIGRHRAHQILVELSIENKLTRDLTGLELNSLRDEVSKYMTGDDLKRVVYGDINRLMNIECYRGYRHVLGFPCRGQRTSTNARTRKELGKHDRNSERNRNLIQMMEKHQGLQWRKK